MRLMPGLVVKTESPFGKETIMKRYCKNICLDRKLISAAVRDCLKNKIGRRDTIRMFSEYSGLPCDMLGRIARRKEYTFFDGIIETVIDGIAEEIRNKQYVVKPIKYHKKVDGCSGKTRCIGVQDIKQQLYDYIAVYSLREVFEKKTGYYQCSAIEGKGQLFGALALKKWIDDHNMRWAWQSDVRHYYETIDKERLKRMLHRDVANKDALHLAFFLIDTFERGLSIGSYLSQFLANYYLSLAYHYASECIFKIRRQRNGIEKRARLVHHVLFFMDDVIFIGASLKDLKMAEKKYRTFVSKELGLEIKETSKYIDLSKDYVDMMGFKISRRNLTIRASNFRRLRRNLKRVDRLKRSGKEIPLKLARVTASRSGFLGHTDSRHFCKRSNAQELMRICNNVISEHDKEAKRENNEI